MSVPKETLRKEILEMVRVDQEMRDSLMYDAAIDRKNTARLLEILDTHGWPRVSMVGEEVAQGVWLLAQHADHDPDVQEKALALLVQAVEAGEAKQEHLAFLTDRVLLNQGKPQLYGTQFYRDSDGMMRVRSVDQIEQLDQRRTEMGMEPFEQYCRKMEEIGERIRRQKEEIQLKNP